MIMPGPWQTKEKARWNLCSCSCSGNPKQPRWPSKMDGTWTDFCRPEYDQGLSAWKTSGQTWRFGRYLTVLSLVATGNKNWQIFLAQLSDGVLCLMFWFQSGMLPFWFCRRCFDYHARPLWAGWRRREKQCQCYNRKRNVKRWGHEHSFGQNQTIPMTNMN